MNCAMFARFVVRRVGCKRAASFGWCGPLDGFDITTHIQAYISVVFDDGMRWRNQQSRMHIPHNKAPQQCSSDGVSILLTKACVAFAVVFVVLLRTLQHSVDRVVCWSFEMCACVYVCIYPLESVCRAFTYHIMLRLFHVATCVLTSAMRLCVCLRCVVVLIWEWSVRCGENVGLLIAYRIILFRRRTTYVYVCMDVCLYYADCQRRFRRLCRQKYRRYQSESRMGMVRVIAQRTQFMYECEVEGWFGKQCIFLRLIGKDICIEYVIMCRRELL